MTSKKRPTPVGKDSQPVVGSAPPLTLLAWQPDGPTLLFDGLRKVTRVGRTKAYELMKSDPNFPKGVPLYDSDRSPRFYWTHEALAWVEARSNKFRNQPKGN